MSTIRMYNVHPPTQKEIKTLELFFQLWSTLESNEFYLEIDDLDTEEIELLELIGYCKDGDYIQVDRDRFFDYCKNEIDTIWPSVIKVALDSITGK